MKTQSKVKAPSTREYWEEFAVNYASKPLYLLANDNCIPWTGNSNNNQSCQELEIFSRIIYSLGGWMFKDKSDTEDGTEIRFKLANWAVQAFNNLFNPRSAIAARPCPQNIIDYGYLSWACLDMMHNSAISLSLLDTVTLSAKDQFYLYHDELKVFRPLANNWVLMAVMPEVHRATVGETYDSMRVDYALSLTLGNYKGGSLYGDGPDLHTDYYNSLVIHPALDTLIYNKNILYRNPALSQIAEKQAGRSARYADILERMISPEGTFPVIGRSATYRLGAFHHLARRSYELPSSLNLGAVRCGLTSVLRRLAPNMFRPDNMLKIGFNSVAEDLRLAEPYINTASLYATGFFLLPLALPINHPFWASPDDKWTQAKLWGGYSVLIDASYGEGITL